MTLPLGIFLYIIIGVACYLLGSISSSIILGRAIYGIDVREHGSCNPGATNTQRVLGWRMGLFVLFFDMFNGIAAASVV
jgi:glycerol-3-phosphate acyltransferase PlsY